MTQCIALIMAAGFARRFGSDKRWTLLPDGKAMIEHVLDAIVSANIAARVVLRDNDKNSREYKWPVPTLTVMSDQAQRGLGASIAAAVRQIPDQTSVLICLADMPYIGVETYRAAVAAIEPQCISVPVFNGRYGHPVGFFADYLAALRELDGDEGARGILLRYRDRVKEIPVTDAAIHYDIDTPADLSIATASDDAPFNE